MLLWFHQKYSSLLENYTQVIVHLLWIFCDHRQKLNFKSKLFFKFSIQSNVSVTKRLQIEVCVWPGYNYQDF